MGKESIEGRDIEQRTPLHLAALTNGLACIHELILRHANIEARDKWQKTPLHYAASESQYMERAASDPAAAIKELIKAHADIEAQDVNQRTPLHYAAEYGGSYVLWHLLRPVQRLKLETINKVRPYILLLLRDIHLLSKHSLEPMQILKLETNGNKPPCIMLLTT